MLKPALTTWRSENSIKKIIRAARLRESGMSYRQVGEAMGYSADWARQMDLQYLRRKEHDPIFLEQCLRFGIDPVTGESTNDNS